MRVVEQANGIAYVEGDRAVLFPFGLAPRLVFGTQSVAIDAPERFGSWDASGMRRAYARAFFAADDLARKVK
jgi:hypothetical protein